MSDDDDTTETAPAADGDDANERTSRAEGGRDGVSVPSWLAAALVVLLGIAIGGAGFALGRATDGDDRGPLGERPIVATRPGQGGPGGLPFPGGREGRGPGAGRHDSGSKDDESGTEEDPSSNTEDDAEGASVFGV